MRALAAALVLAPALASADVMRDPCVDAVVDPIVTPVRDVDLDAQRAACLRHDVSARLLAHVLIDTPGFRGLLGGDLALVGRYAVRDTLELSAQLRVVDFAFVQNAVNKVTHTGFGPLSIGAAFATPIGDGARGAIVGQLEVPYTRDERDTLHTSGAVTAVITGRITDTVVLHARLGAVAMYASSVAGSTQRLAFRAGGDVVWQVRTSMSLQAGADVSAGWEPGLDYVLPRAGLHWRLGQSDWRLRTGAGVPIAGSERTNVVLDVALLHDL